MKKILSVLLALTMTLSLAACGGDKGTTESPTGGNDPASGERAKAACYITSVGLSAPFTAMCWSGVDVLKDQGWTVKCLEVSETTEYADQIRAMAAEGWP